MTEKRFFILKDEEFKDVLPCIRDRNSKIDDIYGHFKYDDIEQICLFLNEQNDENIEMHIQNDFLKDENQHMRDLVNENKQLKEELEFWKKQAKQCPMRSRKND